MSKQNSVYTQQDLIEIHNFLAIGRKYGVSDNAIRKWCKGYGLPYRTKDLYIYYLQVFL